MSSGLLILVSAPSGAGKTSLIDAALKADPRLVVSISHTTRPQRPGEADGVNYHFVTQETFQQMRTDNEFLECAHVFDNQYGTSREQVNALRAQDRDVILEIDWQGADQVREVVADPVTIFILPPNESILKERLINRRQDALDVIERRLNEARLEMAQAGRYDYIIVNDTFAQALVDLQCIISAERLRASHQIAHRPDVASLAGK